MAMPESNDDEVSTTLVKAAFVWAANSSAPLGAGFLG